MTMSELDPVLVDSVREASRQVVRELGFMQATLAATPYPPSAVHAMLEIGDRSSLTGVQLAELLRLEKSSVSRMLGQLVKAGELRESLSKVDGRVKHLALTAKGRRTMDGIQAFGRGQVVAALSHVSESQRSRIYQGLSAYAAALEAQRLGKSFLADGGVQIQQGYQPGAIGRVVEMHARFYSRHAGFGRFFECLVAQGLSEFATRLAEVRNGLWLASYAGRIAGSIAIDGGVTDNSTAHLRWFIVADDVRGTGIGQQLLSEALAFCDRQGFRQSYLWTFKGLDAARRLYEKSGFVLKEERDGEQWGSRVTEQLFVRETTGRGPQ
jgi:DNA-binding MarR family transcriptional regulator/GNAT superfamily N-acetyltransferase